MKNDATLLRLRAANPFADDRADDAALFARITGLSPETPVRRRRRYRPIIVFALAFAGVALLASTAFAISQWVVGDAVEPDVTRTEYRSAQHELTLPPGISWPALHIDPNSLTGRGAGGAARLESPRTPGSAIGCRPFADETPQPRIARTRS